MKKLITFALIIVFLFLFLNFNKSVEPRQTLIRFSSWGSQSEISVLKNVIEEYERKNPSIKIELIHIPKNYFQKLQLLFASGLEPDIIFLNNQNLKLYSSAGLLEDLSAFFDTSGFFKQAVESLSDNGNLYAVPRDVSGLVVYYNKDIFSSAGVSPADIKTFSDFIDLCQKLKNDKYYLFNIEDNPVYFLSFLSAFGAGILSDDGNEVILDNEESLNALNLYSSFIHKHNFSPSKSQIGSMTPAQMFISGKLAMYFSGRWVVPKFRETVSFDWDVFEFPSDNGLYSDASGWALSKKSKVKCEALRFTEYLSSREVSVKFTQSGLIIPARKDVAFDAVFLEKKLHPYSSEVFSDMLEHSRTTPVNKNYSKISDIVGEKIKILIETGSDAHDIIDSDTIKKIKELI